MSPLLVYHGRPLVMPINAIYAAIPNLTRPVLEQLTERMIERMDQLDGDPDVELNGDELDGSAAEDDWHPHPQWAGEAGCPLSDPPEDDLEDCCTAGDDRIVGGFGLWTPMHGNKPLSIGSDEDAEQGEGLAPHGARKSREAHIARIRRTRCYPAHHRYRWDSVASRGNLDIDHYELITEPRVPTLRTLRRRHPRLGTRRRRR